MAILCSGCGTQIPRPPLTMRGPILCPTCTAKKRIGSTPPPPKVAPKDPQDEVEDLPTMDAPPPKQPFVPHAKASPALANAPTSPMPSSRPMGAPAGMMAPKIPKAAPTPSTAPRATPSHPPASASHRPGYSAPPGARVPVGGGPKAPSVAPPASRPPSPALGSGAPQYMPGSRNPTMPVRPPQTPAWGAGAGTNAAKPAPTPSTAPAAAIPRPGPPRPGVPSSSPSAVPSARPAPSPSRRPPPPPDAPKTHEESSEYDKVNTGDFELVQVRPSGASEADDTVETLATGDFESFEPNKPPKPRR